MLPDGIFVFNDRFLWDFLFDSSAKAEILKKSGNPTTNLYNF